MIIMQVNSSEEDIQSVEEHLRKLGFEGQINRGVERTVIGVLAAITVPYGRGWGRSV